MISIEESRKILKNRYLSDEQIKRIRGALYCLGEKVVDDLVDIKDNYREYEKSKNKSSDLLPSVFRKTEK